ncbi:N-acetylglucosamine-6-phosphate deacetylase [Cohaesibacter sp. CAU 1516]|uniref:N-acetylglucosamine-6-phosphate deacetylase n=1 Tax=Cohaesibacter sp. CAU 1516 TaxID=2576038 RepID=UPI0010FE9EBE|nr:N-acetylglucosamine-6-phosphate deacetylase [Cohaesibacter sp. CAU 1516]TLP44971.1 N-acetylglucosamine-6-phosphate deacetylase [Cohaesibacter sp. CAU 1516]
MKQLLQHARLFDGTQFHAGKAVTLDGGLIGDIMERSVSPGGYEVHDLTGLVLAPGFIDVHVFGGGGQMVGADMGLAELEAIAETHRQFGTTSLLPTLLSDEWEVMAHVSSCIRRAHKYWGENSALAAIKGIHFDGPCLSPSIGAPHHTTHLRRLDAALIDLMSHPDLGIRLVTLAPERAGLDSLKALTEAGVLVCAGSSAATHQEALQAIRAGLRGVTKLFAHMPPIGAAAPGLVGAALDDQELWCGLLADGFHVHPAAMRMAIKAKAKGKVFLTSGAMASVGWDGEKFDFQGRGIRVRNGVCIFADGTMAGAHLTMIGAVRNAVELLDQPLSEALRMASLYPAQFIRMDMTHGIIAPGFAADLVAFDPENWVVKHSWINGYHRAH